jgi:hypothetical protein
MASVNVTSAYVGNTVDTLLELMVLGNQAVQKGSVHVEVDVKKALYLPRITADADQLQTRAETPSSPSDSFTYAERSLTPLDAMFYDTVNPRYFEAVWRPFQPTGPLVDRVDNPQVLNAILRETVKTVGAQLGKIIWQGDTAGAAAIAFFDGYEKIIANDAASIKATPSGAITAANVISILELVEAAIPDAIYEDPNVIFHMSTQDLRLYKEAARALDFKGSNITEALDERFAGRAIRSYSGLSKNKIIVAKATTGTDSNLWAGVDVEGDEENVKVERYRPESELFIVKVLFKYAVQVAQPEESVIYLPA